MSSVDRGRARVLILFRRLRLSVLMPLSSARHSAFVNITSANLRRGTLSLPYGLLNLKVVFSESISGLYMESPFQISWLTRKSPVSNSLIKSGLIQYDLLK